MLHRITSTPARVWMGRGTQGVTVQEITVSHSESEVWLAVRRVGGDTVTVALDPNEAAALREWLMPVP